MYQTKPLLERDYYTTFSPGAQEQKSGRAPAKICEAKFCGEEEE